MLEESLLSGRAQLGAQKAENIAGLAGVKGEYEVARQTAISQIADALQNRSITEREAKLKMQSLERDFRLRRQAAEREYKLAVQKAAIERQREAAAAAAAYSGGGGNAPQETVTKPAKQSQFDKLLIGLKNKLDSGDTKAAQALKQIEVDPFWKQNRKRYVQLYGRLLK